ncbi:hypothetical protein OF83DRAFT_433460 [Amylostereum chailletii]|nr:hypothetical protein OF83DRAFT_433460 [Amylostereum chailletii]
MEVGERGKWKNKKRRKKADPQGVRDSRRGDDARSHVAGLASHSASPLIAFPVSRLPLARRRLSTEYLSTRLHTSWTWTLSRKEKKKISNFTRTTRSQTRRTGRRRSRPRGAHAAPSATRSSKFDNAGRSGGVHRLMSNNVLLGCRRGLPPFKAKTHWDFMLHLQRRTVHQNLQTYYRKDGALQMWRYLRRHPPLRCRISPTRRLFLSGRAPGDLLL